MRKVLLILGLLPILTFSQVTSQRIITVRGEAEKSIEPDRIELTIVFSETENIKRENELQQKEEELINLIKGFSIDLKKLTVDNLAAKRYGYYNSSSNKVRMSKVFKLQLDNITLIDSLLLRLFEIGANDVSVTNLQSDKFKEMKLDVTKQALDDARIKAETMAKHSGYDIGQILEINEYNPEIKHAPTYDEFNLASKTFTAYGVNQISTIGGEDIGIRKIIVRFVVDVKYELE